MSHGLLQLEKEFSAKLPGYLRIFRAYLWLTYWLWTVDYSIRSSTFHSSAMFMAKLSLFRRRDSSSVRPCVQFNKSNSEVCNPSWSRRTMFALRTWRNRIKYRKRRIPINQNRKLPLSASDGHATSAHRLHTKTQTGYTTCQCMYSSRYDTFLLPCCVSISALRNNIFFNRHDRGFLISILKKKFF